MPRHSRTSILVAIAFACTAAHARRGCLAGSLSYATLLHFIYDFLAACI